MASRNKRARVSGFLVTATAADPDEDVSGLDVLVGEYLQSSQESYGQPVFEKSILSNGSDDEPSQRPCLLYYWDGEEEENVGWWFGQDIGGSMVFCFARKQGFPPPITGWCIPAEEEVPVKCLRVVSLNDSGNAAKVVPARVTRPQSGATSASGDTRPSDLAKAWQPPPPPPPQRPAWAAQGNGFKPKGPISGGGEQQPPPPLEKREGPGRFHRLHIEAGSEDQPVGVRLSSNSFPPLILEVRAGSLAAEKGVKPGFELHAVNGQTLLDTAAVERAKEMLRQRPLWLDVRDPGPAARVHAVAGATAVPDTGPQWNTPGGAESPAAKLPIVPPGQGRWVPPSSPLEGPPQRVAKLALALSEDEALCWERLLTKVQEEKEAGQGRPIWSRLKAVAATLDKPKS